MNVTIIGTGNCAAILARLCKDKGHSIKEIIGRNEVAGTKLAAETSAKFIYFNDAADKQTDLVIVALSDSALPGALEKINFSETPAVHTAGAVPMNVLRNVSKNFGILYPVQSVNKQMTRIPDIPFIIEGSNEQMQVFIRGFALTISDKVEYMDEEKRLRLHAAAVIVNNFTNYLYTVAKTFCEQEKIDFNLLKPLIQETAKRIMDNSPADVQTGPAIRKDITTLDKHLRVLSTYPKLRTMYMRMTDGIMNDL